MDSPPLLFHVVHHQKLCWQLIHDLNLDINSIRNIWLQESVLRNVSCFLMLPSNSSSSESCKSLSGACWASVISSSKRGMPHIHTAARWRGVQTVALQAVQWGTLIAIIITWGYQQEDQEIISECVWMTSGNERLQSFISCSCRKTIRRDDVKQGSALTKKELMSSACNPLH